MPRQALVLVVFGASVVALFAVQISTSQRLARQSDQLARLEEKLSGMAAPEAAQAPGRARESDSPAPGGASPIADAPKGSGTGTDAPVDPEAAATKKKHKPGGDDMLTRDEVAKLIDQKLTERDKNNPLAGLMQMEDPMTLLERELKLSPIQKTRITEHWKERDDAIMALWQDQDARKDWKAVQEKSEELRKKSEESVKRELDLAQQDKYDELKKSGKLVDWGGGGGGVSFVRSVKKSKSTDDGGALPAGK